MNDVVTVKPQELQSVPENQSPLALMQQALASGVDLDKIDRLIELQAKWDAMEAKKAYHRAMAEFKKNPPTIYKDKKVGYESTRTNSVTSYHHASLGNVTNLISAALAEHGLSATWETAQADGKITVTCKIPHSMGHGESTSLSASPDTSGSKNSIQAIGSTITYLERYTVLALTGLATHDQDDDGAGAEPKELLTEKELATIVDMVADCGADMAAVLGWLGYEKKEDIERKDYNRAVVNLKARKERGAKK